MLRLILILSLLVVLATQGSTARAAFAGANGKIAFVSTRDGNGDADVTGDTDIYVMNSDGTAQTRLTSAAGDDMDPTWSANGAKLAFASDRDGSLHVYVMGADGSGQTKLTTSGAPNFDPVWSPDGAKIAFTSTRGGSGDIYVMNADGSGVANLTQTPAADEQYPSWSPDGAKIAFTSNRDGDDEIFVMNADGSAPTQLTANTTNDYNADWSPSGLQLAFASERDAVTPGGSTAVAAEIYVMDALGGAPVRLTTNAVHDDEPSWSPDGTSVAYASASDRLVSVVVDTGLAGLLDVASPGLELSPSWQPTLL